MNSKFKELTDKLKEIFQIDKPELDFGIYRILHARSKEINDFLENRLAAKVKEALAGNAAAEKMSLEAELAKAIQDAKALGVPDPDAVPRVQELKAKLGAMGGGSDQAESEVYSHLLTFFSRYYDDGDFISKRRYKGDTYAIPYSGEEVKLHWANADQYYVKSGENFTNYDFTIDGGAKVHFKLVTAETAKDNIKDNEADRRFVLWDPSSLASPVSCLTDAADDPDIEPLPTEIIEEKDGELYIYFQYIKVKKGTKQKDLMDEAEKKVMALLSKFQKFLALATPAPTEKDKKRTLLRKHFEDYAAKNTSDYFIHKDLKGFLTRELDFYIKNEMMHLDDIQDATAFKQIETGLRAIQAVRTIASELIAFMAQIEDFQKKLWLKKKFVTRCDYCITLDRVPEALHAEVFANAAQQEEWKKLGFPVGSAPRADRKAQGELDLGDSAASPIDGRMVDTKFFPEEFKAKLLAAIPDLDAQCDGVLIHGDNFQGIQLLRNRFDRKVSTTYIDPPYNAKSSEIYYKNTFKHSAWLAFMENRLDAASSLMSNSSGLVIAIDENEQVNLGRLLQSKYASDVVNVDCVTVIHNPGGIQGSNFSFTHEYAYFIYPNRSGYITNEKRNSDVNPELTPFRDWGKENSKRTESPNCFYPIIIQNGSVVKIGEIPPDDFHPSSANEEDGEMIKVWPIDISGTERRWRFAQNTVQAIFQELKAVQIKGVWNIQRAKMFFTRKTVWDDPKYCANVSGTQLLAQMLRSPFSFPKSLFLVKDCVQACEQTKDGIVLDYFGGSGTTAHAVIALNREDGGHRKYILVEMGDHFDTVLKPRIEKVVYSPDWKDGKPTNAVKGISHCFKYLTLESYEDALNNIELEDKGGLFGGALKDEYLLKYMLNLESRGSVINTDNFRKPFDYELKIAVDSSGASEKRKVDLVETFNYLIGLTVLTMDRHIDKGYVMVTGTLPGEDKETLIVWRDCDKIDNAALNKLLETKGVKPGDTEFRTIFVNGDHAIPNKTLGADEGSPELKIRQIENTFIEKMFEEK